MFSSRFLTLTHINYAQGLNSGVQDAVSVEGIVYRVRTDRSTLV